MSTMNKPIIAAMAALVSVFTLLAVPMPKASAQANLQDADIAKALRAGDLVMVVRHGATERLGDGLARQSAIARFSAGTARAGRRRGAAGHDRHDGQHRDRI